MWRGEDTKREENENKDAEDDGPFESRLSTILMAVYSSAVAPMFKLNKVSVSSTGSAQALARQFEAWTLLKKN